MSGVTMLKSFIPTYPFFLQKENVFYCITLVFIYMIYLLLWFLCYKSCNVVITHKAQDQ